MPQANVWIRDEDWDKWQAVPEKSAFVSNAINAAQTIDGLGAFVDTRISTNFASNPDDPGTIEYLTKVGLARAPDGSQTVNVPFAKKVNTCKAGHLATDGKCLQKGCKYAR